MAQPRICYLDAFSGISGDMTVAALADAGADQAALIEGLTSLGTGATFRFEKTKRRGIAATSFHVDTPPAHGHRHLPKILDMIDRAALPARVKQSASDIFRRLGEAEAQVHGVAVEKVHFHEVGAVDSICDIVGASLGFELLDVAEVHSAPLNVGSGTVQTEHGLLPVPAPATAELLRGKPVYARGPQVELTTPTGAAIAATLACSFGPLPPLAATRIGYGAGTKDFAEQANVLRVIVGELSGASEATTVYVLEANIDDATPEILGYAMERLLEHGALDVTMQPVVMKKSRPGTMVRVIARPEDKEALAGLILAETTTLGLRLYVAERRIEARRSIEVQTEYGAVSVKVSGKGAFAPEYEDCRKLALASGAPLKLVLAAASFAYLKQAR